MTNEASSGLGLCLGLLMIAAGCAERPTTPVPLAEHVQVGNVAIPDTRTPIRLPDEAARTHREVMLQHLETVQVIVAALAEENYELAKGLTETHLGFFMHRQAMARQSPENFPPGYHDLAMAHHRAAEELAEVMPTRDLKRILPKFNGLLKACVACHLEYKVAGTHTR